ncbi:MAG: NUDIX domain-containing protein [Alphaproteobacteria bacterium]|nr:NUDIX domain-containing protein [Alphaproteobacteria bacterium]OJV14094.1 MAG: hypothetical protein BGO27_01235 [Alphaproteobacteria bacterium 33-17]
MKFEINNSHLGVYGVILNEDKTKILVIEKAIGFYKGLYDLPGGTPEFEESLEETLIREILEETGMEVTNSKQLGAYLNIFNVNNTKYRHTAILYNVSARGNHKTDPDGQDSNGSIWLDIDTALSDKSTEFVKIGLRATLNI